MSSSSPSSDERRTTIRQLLKQTSDCGASDEPVVRDVTEDGEVTLKWSVVMDLSGDKRRKGERRTDEFSPTQISDLRSLAETTDRESVRRAARAVVRYAAGETMAEAVASTPYGIGWLRALREDIHENGVEYLLEREYRPPD